MEPADSGTKCAVSSGLKPIVPGKSSSMMVTTELDRPSISRAFGRALLQSHIVMYLTSNTQPQFIHIFRHKSLQSNAITFGHVSIPHSIPTHSSTSTAFHSLHYGMIAAPEVHKERFVLLHLVVVDDCDVDLLHCLTISEAVRGMCVRHSMQ